MNIALAIGDWLIILAFLGLIIASALILVAALRLKNDVVRNAKRLYERPVRAANNLATASKGLVQQEAVRVADAGKNIKAASTAVGATISDMKTAGEGLRDIDWPYTFAAIQGIIKLAGVAADVARSAPKQGPH